MRPGPHGGHSGGDGGAIRERHDEGAGGELDQAGDGVLGLHREIVEAGEVDEHDVEGLALEQFGRLPAARDFGDARRRQERAAQIDRHDTACGRVTVDQQESRGGVRSSAGRRRHEESFVYWALGCMFS